jgi:type I restriction enzyme S subunit
MTANSHILDLELMQARVKFIPIGWKFLNVGSAFAIRNNLRKPINEDEREAISGEYPYYGPTKIQGYINTFEQDGAYALIGEDGDHFLKFSSHSMTQLVDGKCTVNNHAHIIEGTETATREWFYYYFMHRDIFSFLSRQGAGRYKLNKASLEKMPLLVPPISEQKKIAQILSTWDKAIATTEKLLENSNKQKQALMQQLLTGKKRIFGFDKKWQLISLSKIVKETRIRSTENNQYSIITSSRKGIFLQEEYFKKQVASSDTTGYKIVPKGHVTFRTMSDDGIFVFNRQMILENALISPAYGVFEFVGVEPFFATHLINCHEMTKAIVRLSQGGTRTAFKVSDFKDVVLQIPTLEEQKKISEVLFCAEQEVKLIQYKLDLLINEKKALMQQMLTGMRRVRVN